MDLNSTMNGKYTDRLIRLQSAWWKKILNVQALYGWNLRKLKPGYMLDIGCGIGRNLLHVNGNGVGIDHNKKMVEAAISRGLIVLAPENFYDSKYAQPGKFDSILLSHVAEHMKFPEAVDLLQRFLPYLKTGGKVIIITPQEAGYRSDSTHVEFIDFKKVGLMLKRLKLKPAKAYSFPFPRFFGRFFKYNEFISVSII